MLAGWEHVGWFVFEDCWNFWRISRAGIVCCPVNCPGKVLPSTATVRLEDQMATASCLAAMNSRSGGSRGATPAAHVLVKAQARVMLVLSFVVRLVVASLSPIRPAPEVGTM